MKALVLEATGVLRMKNVQEPAPFGERPVLVRVGAVGVCGSDVIRFAKGKVYHLPLVLGHEFSAIVEEVPQGSKFNKGDRVVVYPLLPDLEDPFSRIGAFNVSGGYDYFGSRRDGAFEERLYVPEKNLIPIPHDIPLIHAAVTEPAAVALHGVLKFHIPAHASALVIGCGPIGALAAQWLRVLGASQVYVADVDPRKCAIMESLGFTAINALERDTVAAIRELTGGKGADCVVEASGIPKTFVQAIEAAGVFGQVLFLGDVNGNVALEDSLISSILRRELTLHGTWNSRNLPSGKSEWDMVLAQMGKGLQISPLISHMPILEQGPQVFADMASRNIWYNKVVFPIAPEAMIELK